MNMLDLARKTVERIVEEASIAWRMGCLCTGGKEVCVNGRAALASKMACFFQNAVSVLGSLAPRLPCHQPGPGITCAGAHTLPLPAPGVAVGATPHPPQVNDFLR